MNTVKLAQHLERSGWQVRWLTNNLSPLSGVVQEHFQDATTLQHLQSSAGKVSSKLLHRWLAAQPVALLFTPYNKDIKSLSMYKRLRNRSVKLVYQQHMKVGVRKKDIIHRLRYNMLDLWISPLPYLKEETLEKTTVPAHRVEIVPLGIDPDILQTNGLTRDEALRKLDLEPGHRWIGVLGRIDPKKGQDFLIRSMAQLRDQFQQSYCLLIMGNITPNEGDEYLNHLHDLVKRHQLEQHVFFRPYQKEVSTFYTAIDVFAMPSHGETYGMVTLEAMASGKPVIGVNTDGTAALLQNGQLGWLFELEDMQGFCRQLTEAEKEPGRSLKIEAAKREVLTRFLEADAMRQTERVLRDLLTGIRS